LSYRRHSKKRRGIGTVLATGIFVFIAIFITSNLMIWSIGQYADFQSTVDRMTQFDQSQRSENVALSQALFGDTHKYVVDVATSTVTGTAKTLPVLTMNLTTNTEGWVFNRILPPGGITQGISGGYDAGAVQFGAIGSPSGPGLIYMGVSFFPSSGSVTYTGIWSFRFFIDLAKFGFHYPDSDNPTCIHISSSPFTCSNPTVEASWAWTLPGLNSGVSRLDTGLQITNGSAPPTISPTTTSSCTGVVGSKSCTFTIDSISYATLADQSWNFDKQLDLSAMAGFTSNFWGNGPGWFNIQVKGDFILIPSATPAEVRLLFDDVGIAFNYPSSFIQSSGAPPSQTFVIMDFPLVGGEDTALIQQLTASSATSFSQANVQQTVFLKDFSTGVFNSISTSLVSQATTNTSVTFEAASVQNFIGTASSTLTLSGTVTVPAGSTLPIGTTFPNGTVLSSPRTLINSGTLPSGTQLPTGTKYVEMKIEALFPTTITASTMRGSIQDFFKDTTHVTIIIPNTWSSTTRVADIWIVDSNGHTCFSNSLSTCRSWNGVFIAAGTQAVISLQYNWVNGPVTIKAITNLGNVVTLTTIAG
jgi:hypothetical protein